MDIEQAYRILDLQPGATLRQIAEARDELRILWDPDRLARHPGLHVKAPGKIEEIEQAYEVLMNHLGRTDLAGSSRAGARPKIVSSSGPRSTERPQASLFEEVFSKQESKAAIHARRAIPGWVPSLSSLWWGCVSATSLLLRHQRQMSPTRLRSRTRGISLLRTCPPNSHPTNPFPGSRQRDRPLPVQRNRLYSIRPPRSQLQQQRSPRPPEPGR